MPLTVAAQRCSRPGALTVVAAPRALTVAAQSLQPGRQAPSQSLHSRCRPSQSLRSVAEPPRCPLQSLQVPRPSQSLRSVAALRGWGWGGWGWGWGVGRCSPWGLRPWEWGLGPGALEDCWERFSESR